VDHRNIKALFRLARALRMLGNYGDAKKQISKAHRLDPGNGEVMEELHRLDEVMKKSRKDDEALCRKMLNMKVNVPPVEEKVETKESSQMVTMVNERLKKFLNEKNLKEIMLPNTLTDDEIDNIKKLVLEMKNLSFNVRAEGNQKCIRVSKISDDEEVCR